MRFLRGSLDSRAPSSLTLGQGEELTAWVAQFAACSYSVGWYLRLDGTR